MKEGGKTEESASGGETSGENRNNIGEEERLWGGETLQGRDSSLKGNLGKNASK